MAYIFGDGFDLYTAAADAQGYWDTVGGTPALIAGRFAGRGFTMSATTSAFTKSSGVNGDAVHHITIAFIQTSALSGTNIGVYLQLLDGVTGQCAICFRQDGTILLTSGSAAGATLATYPNAFLQNIWYGFEFEVVINNATGSFTVRRNGNTSADFTQSGLITRPTSPNNYANKLILGFQTAGQVANIDDMLWRSDISAVGWAGDIRCYTRMPATDVGTAQFSRAPSNPVSVSGPVVSATTSRAANAGMMSAFQATFSASITSGTVSINTGGTGNMKAAIYDSTRTIVLATSNPVVNPISGLNTITFVPPLSVTEGTTYYLAVDQDTTIIYNTTAASQYTFTTTYASFPTANPAGMSSNNQPGPVFTLSITSIYNAEFVNEFQQDGLTSYVFDNIVGDADFYNLAATTSTPLSVLAVTTRGYLAKSDSGVRVATMQLKSGITTVPAPPLTLSTGFLWAWRTDLTDPNTSATWTPANVNAVQIGPYVVS